MKAVVPTNMVQMRKTQTLEDGDLINVSSGSYALLEDKGARQRKAT